MRTDVPERWAELIAAKYPREPQIQLLRDPSSGIISPGSYSFFHRHLASGTLTRKLFDKPSIGNAACATLKFRTVTPGAYSRFPDTSYPSGFQYYPQTLVMPKILVRESGTSFETLSWNTFYTDVRKVYPRPDGPYGTTGSMEFVCYDRMIYAEAEYEDQVGTYPMPAADVVAYIAEQLGVSVDERSEIGDFDVDSPTGVYTMREVLRFIAAGSGGNFVINSMGKLQLVPFGSPAESAEELCSELDYAVDLTITGVRLFPDSDTQYFSGDETGFVIEGECAYATKELCDAVAEKLIGKVYRAFEAKEVRLDPAAELGDSIRLGGIDFMISSISYKFSTAMAATIGAPWLEDVEHQIPYQSRDRQTRMNARSFSEIRKSTEEIALEVQGKTDSGDVNSLIQTSLEGITLSTSMDGVTGKNSCKLILKSETGDVIFETTGIIQMGNVSADSISASNVTAGTLQADEINTAGSFNVGYGTDEDFEPTGYMGAGFGADANLENTYGVILAASSSTQYGSGDCYVIVTNGGVRLQAGSNRVVVTPKNISITSAVGDVLVNGNPVGQAVFG